MDRRFGRLSWIWTAAAFQPADRSHGHIVIAFDLAGESDAGKTFFCELRLFRQRHARRLAVDELDAARRAARVPPARVQDVDARILLDRQHETLALLHIDGREPFHGQLRHARYVNVSCWTWPPLRTFLGPRSCGSRSPPSAGCAPPTSGHGRATELRQYPVVVLDLARGPASRELVSRFRAPYFKLTPPAWSDAEVVARLDRGQASLAVVIPPDFERRVQQGTARFQVISDGSQSMVATLAGAHIASIAHGYASITRFFPGARDVLAAIDEEIVLSALGPPLPGKASCFEDQYASTGGQLYELMAGHDRFVADLRPLVRPFLADRGLPPSLSCHPYDVCCALIAEEGGVVVTDAYGRALDTPLNVEADVAWVGYANAQIRAQIEPLLQSALRERGLLLE